jgi:hypothetical protein
VIHSITSIHACHVPGIHPNVRAPRTADDAHVAERDVSHVGRGGLGSWREEGVTLGEEGWVRMTSGGVPAPSQMHVKRQWTRGVLYEFWLRVEFGPR